MNEHIVQLVRLQLCAATTGCDYNWVRLQLGATTIGCDFSWVRHIHPNWVRLQNNWAKLWIRIRSDPKLLVGLGSGKNHLGFG
jgi:hypothetical protein